MKKKRVLSLLMTALLTVGLLPSSVLADTEAGTLADPLAETPTGTAAESEAVSAEVTIRSQTAGKYLHGFDGAVSVSSNLAEDYGYDDPVTDGVSVLDAMVKAHELAFGEDFSDETAASYLELGEDGSVKRLFGMETAAECFALNGGYPNAGRQTEDGDDGAAQADTQIQTGDVLDFFTYTDTEAWSDAMSWLELDNTEVPAGFELVVTAQSSRYSEAAVYEAPEDFRTSASAAAGAKFAWVDPETGAVTEIEGASADENGQATVMAPAEEGVYYLTAAGSTEEGSSLLLNPAALTVTAAQDTPASQDNATASQNTPAAQAAIAAVSVSGRLMDSAEVTVQADSAGSIYYLVQEAGADAPDAAKLESGGTRADAVAGENVLKVTGLTKAAQKIYVLLKAADGTASEILSADIAEYDNLLSAIMYSNGTLYFDTSKEATAVWDADDTSFRLVARIPAGTTAKDPDLKLTYRYTNISGTESTVEGTANGTYVWFNEDFLTVGGKGNDLTIVAEKNGVTQTYVLHVNRKASLDALEVTSQEGRAVTLSPTFSSTKTEYTATVLDSVTSLNLKAVDPIEAVSPDSSQVLFNGAASADGSYVWELQPGENKMVIRADNGSAESVEYTLTITQTASVTLTVQTNPQDASFALYQGSKNETRIWPEEDGTFRLFPDTEYNYTVARSDYVGQSGSLTLSASETRSFTLEKAPEAEELPQLDADYPGFRSGLDNMSVVNSKTPISKETIEVVWERQMGDYVSPTSGTTPIVVDDKIYGLTGTTLYMLDKETGETIRTATTVSASAFNLVPPTYADGMLFVLLSGGQVQCFNASTLESMWVYTDPQGGRCESSVRYDDGYIYVGFFASTTVGGFACISVTDEDPSSQTEEKVPIWRNSSLGSYYWDGAWSNENYVFVITNGGTLCCIDKKTGDAVQTVATGQTSRSNISYYNGRIYWANQSGYLYSYNLTADGRLDMENLIEPLYFGGASTSTPAIYNNRVYIGISNGGNFGVEGYGILVGDINPETGAMSAAYVVPTDGYPQTSGLIVNGYEEEDGYVYVYFLTNSAHGTLYMVKDKAGMTEADSATGAFYTPNHEQYCIASAVADSDGNIYIKNDSAWQFVIRRSALYLKEITAVGGNAVLDGGAAFDGSQSDHTITVDAGTSSLKLELTPSDGVTVAMNGVEGQSQEIEITDGTAEIQVLLRKGEEMRVYNFTVYSGPTLTTLYATSSPNAGMGTTYSLSPEFAPMTEAYAAGIDTAQSTGYIWIKYLNDTDSLKVTAGSGVSGKAEGDELTATVNYKGDTYIRVPFAERTNPTTATVRLTLTSADGTQSRTYTVILYTQNALPLLTLDEGAVSERTDTSASLTLNSNKAGELHWLVQEASEAAPGAEKIMADGQKVEIAEGANTVALTGLSQKALAVYLVLKDAGGNTSLTYRVDIASSRIQGDLNGDGRVTNADVALLLDEVTAGEATDLEAGDLNGDGRLTNADVALLLDWVTAGEI